MAHYAMGVIHARPATATRAGAEFRLARDAAPDPVYQATVDTNLGGYLANAGQTRGSAGS